MKFSSKTGVGFLASIALFSAMAQGGATVISQTRTIDYYVQPLDSTTHQPVGSPQLGASQSAPDFGPFNSSVGNTFGTWAQQSSSISGLAVDGFGAGGTVRSPTGSVNYIGDSETSVTFLLDSSMTYSFTQDYGNGELLGPNNQTITFPGTFQITTGTIGPGQWTVQATAGPVSTIGYDFAVSLTPEPATMGIVLVPLLIARRRCRG
jgi:hypothetical protein